MIETITGIGLFIVALATMAVGAYFAYYFLNKNIKGKKVARDNKKACAQANRAIAMRNMTDYFWKESITFTWIVVLLAFFIALGFVTWTFWGLLSSIILIIIAGFFGRFAYKSYNEFEAKAKARLAEFENDVRKSIKAEISFSGDNIQSFSDEDEAFDTEPKIFEFPTDVKKDIPFPPLEKNPKKHPIIRTKKIEFLVLSREYFSICKGAATFNLFEPKQAPLPKKCVELKGVGGECNEYYYSQMQNVQYDEKEECIRIIYNANTGHADVTFACKKANPNRKPAMKALKEKLRLTERQKLQKIQEHKHYEDIREKRERAKAEAEAVKDKEE